MYTLVKVCGITRIDDAAAVARAGAQFLGLNFWPRSKRVVTVDVARALADAARNARPGVRVVGLFVDAPLAEIVATAAAVDLDIIQLHGDERPELCQRVSGQTQRPVWKAVPVSGPADVADLGRWPVSGVLLDTATPGRGGSGQPFDWSIAAAAKHGATPLILAGGLDPDNVARAIETVRPWAVDVASGVESAPGVKDLARVAAFLAAVRGASS